MRLEFDLAKMVPVSTRRELEQRCPGLRRDLRWTRGISWSPLNNTTRTKYKAMVFSGAAPEKDPYYQGYMY